jgi:hypothetical protein
MMAREGISVDMVEKTCDVCATSGPEKLFSANEMLINPQRWNDCDTRVERRFECPDCKNEWSELENLEE